MHKCFGSDLYVIVVQTAWSCEVRSFHFDFYNFILIHSQSGNINMLSFLKNKRDNSVLDLHHVAVCFSALPVIFTHFQLFSRLLIECPH